MLPVWGTCGPRSGRWMQPLVVVVPVVSLALLHMGRAWQAIARTGMHPAAPMEHCTGACTPGVLWAPDQGSSLGAGTAL